MQRNVFILPCNFCCISIAHNLFGFTLSFIYIIDKYVLCNFGRRYTFRCRFFSLTDSMEIGERERMHAYSMSVQRCGSCEG